MKKINTFGQYYGKQYKCWNTFEIATTTEIPPFMKILGEFNKTTSLFCAWRHTTFNTDFYEEFELDAMCEE